MALPVEKRRYTAREYLASEAKSEQKHEFDNGEILAMSGGTYSHSLISLNFGGELRSRLKGKPCRVLESNMRVNMPESGRYVYPDLSVICQTPQFDPNDPNQTTILNPRVVIEVLSDSSEGYDRGAKFSGYRTIESLEEYVLVSQREPQIESFLRQPDGTWSLSATAGIEQTFRLRCLNVDVPLAEIYDGITFVGPLPPPADTRRVEA